jgi:hypothetical protein
MFRVRLSPTPRVFLCAQGASNVSQSHDNSEYGLVNGIQRTAGITVGATELMWFDMDGACQGNVDLGIRSVETLPESQSLVRLMHYQILINLDNFGAASMKRRSDGGSKARGSNSSILRQTRQVGCGH